MQLNELIGFTVGVILILALITLMIWISARSLGKSTRMIRLNLLKIWGSIIFCIVGLAGLRILLGGDVTTQRPDARMIIILLVGLIWMVGWFLYALRMVHYLQSPDLPTHRE